MYICMVASFASMDGGFNNRSYSMATLLSYNDFLLGVSLACHPSVLASCIMQVNFLKNNAIVLFSVLETVFMWVHLLQNLTILLIG